MSACSLILACKYSTMISCSLITKSLLLLVETVTKILFAPLISCELRSGDSNASEIAIKALSSPWPKAELIMACPAFFNTFLTSMKSVLTSPGFAITSTTLFTALARTSSAFENASFKAKSLWISANLSFMTTNTVSQ